MTTIVPRGAKFHPAQMFQSLALVGIAAYRRVQTETLMVGTGLLGAVNVQRHRAL